MFSLHPRLAADTFYIADSALSSILLMNNAAFPWLILVPRAEAASEIIDLSPADRSQLMEEISFASELMRKQFLPDKLNVAALGNQVPQLHVHIIARYKTDAAWPNPVWGGVSKTYGDTAEILQSLRAYYTNPV